MVQNDALINALRSLGFTFKQQMPRMMMYKQSGTTKRVLVRRNASHDDEVAASILRQAGMPEPEIKAFLASCSNHH